MNPYRCETCKKVSSIEPFDCPLSNYIEELPSMEKEYYKKAIEKIIKIVGCASHGDFQSEREKVLDELKVKTTLKKVYHVYDDHLRGLTFYVKLDDIYKVVEALRQECKVEDK